MDLEAGETYHSIKNCSVSFTWMAITLRQRFLKKRSKKRKKTLSTESLNTLLVRELFGGTLKMVTSFILSILHILKIWEFISTLALGVLFFKTCA